MNAPYIVDREGHSKDKLTSMVYAVLHSAQSSGDPTHVYTVKRHSRLLELQGSCLEF